MATLLIALVTLAGAQPASDSHQAAGQVDAGEQIVVTGERVQRTTRRTTSSVVVLTADEIEKQPGADRVDQVLEQVPNVQYGSGGLGPTIRGQDTTGSLQDLPAFLGGNRPRVTLQVDGRAVGFNEFVFGAAPTWDVERIEVFRSPQSTTQGRNSVAGAIFVTSKSPTFQPEASARAIAGNYSTRQLSVVASGPLIADEVAVRVAGDLRRSDSFAEIRDGLEGADPNHHSYGLVRVKVLAQPRAVPNARFEASYSHTESRLPQFESVFAPFQERRNPVGVPVFGTNVDSLTASLGFVFGGNLDGVMTVSLGRSRFRRFAARGLGETDNRINDGSFESVWHWRPSETLLFTGGLHYIGTELKQFIDLSAVIGLGEFVDRQRSLGLFGEGALQLTPELSLTAGLRYQRDAQDRHGRLGPESFAGLILFDESFDAWLPKISMAYDLSSQITAGVLVQRAYNPGGTTLNFDTFRQDDFDAEKLWSYELFVRAYLPKAGVRLGANLFYNDFRDAQRTETRAFFVPGSPTAFWAIIHNVPKARSYGLEVSIDWQASGRLRFRGGLGLLGTKIVDAGEFALIQGNEFQRSPSLTASANVEWTPIDRLSLSAAIRHNDGYFSNDANSPLLFVEQSTRLDARAAYDRGPITLFGYVRNILDEFHMSQLFSPLVGTPGEPRQVGIGLELRS